MRSPTTATLPACSVPVDKPTKLLPSLIVSRLWQPQELEERNAGNRGPRLPQASCLYKLKLHIETEDKLILSLRGEVGIPANLLHLMAQAALATIPHYFSRCSKTCDNYPFFSLALNCGYYSHENIILYLCWPHFLIFFLIIIHNVTAVEIHLKMDNKVIILLMLAVIISNKK